MKAIAILGALLPCTFGIPFGVGPNAAPVAVAAARAAEWDMSLSPGAAVQIRHKGAPIVSASYLFWGANWAWQSVDVDAGPVRDDRYPLTGGVKGLGIGIGGDVARSGPGTLTFTYVFDASRPLEGITGGGIEWNLDRASASFAAPPPDPVLLPDNTGWQWAVGGGNGITVRFSQPVASVYFERGNRGIIRTMLVGTALPAGKRTVTMTVSLPVGGELVRSAAERYGPADTTGWHRNALLWNASPVDLSYLNHKPAGSLGFVRAEGDRLVYGDGSEARFWGGNLAAYALFDDKDRIKEQAKRIAALGFNLMRLHHHDSMRWVSPTVIDKNLPDSQHLSAEGLDKIDWWIKCLKDEGVYVWLDLHVGRSFKPGDAVPGFEELARRDGEGKGFNYYNERVEALMKEFQHRYLTHVNPYTGLAYKDDPAVMGLLLTNENDVTHHFGNLMLGDKGNPHHNAIFEKSVREWSAKNNLPADQVGRTWEAGASKLYLNDIEAGWNRRMLAHLKSIGVRVPVATTNYWGGEGLYSLPALTTGGIIDIHSYGGPEALSTNPRYAANFIPWIGAGQIAGYPSAITEWNVEYPSVDRFTAPLYVASIAALQGWDAPMIYNYSQRPFASPDREDKWSTFYDPALTGLMPAAALLYREGHVSPARERYVLQLDRNNAYLKGWSPSNAATIRTLVEQHRISIGLPDTPELAWDKTPLPEPGVKIVTDPDKDFIPAGQSVVQSDTGELRRNWETGVQVINTPKTQAVSGWIGGEEIALADSSFGISTNKATAVLSSLDDRPLGVSRKILLSVMARVVASPGGRTPYLSEPVTGIVTLRSAAPALSLVPLAPDGKELTPIPLVRMGGVYTVKLPAGGEGGTQGTHWYLLR